MTDDSPVSKIGSPRRKSPTVLLVTAIVLSALGDGVLNTAIPVMGSTVTKSAFTLSLLRFSATLPWLLLTPVAGALADRYSRSRLILYTQFTGAILVVAFLGWLTTYGISVTLLLVSSFMLTTTQVIVEITVFSIVVDLTPDPERYSRINSMLVMAQLIGLDLVGPLLGANTMTISASLAYWIDLASYSAAFLLLWVILRGAIPSLVAVQSATTGLWSQIFEGQRFLFGNRLLRRMSIAVATLNFFGVATAATLILFVTETLGGHSADYGILLAVQGLAGLIGGLVVPRLMKKLGPTGALYGCFLSFSLFAMVTGFANSLLVAAIGLAIIAGTGIYWNIATVTLRQQIVPAHLLGRVNSTYRLLSLGVLPLGSLFGGVIATQFGLRAPYILASLAAISMAIGLALTRISHGRKHGQKSVI